MSHSDGKGISNARGVDMAHRAGDSAYVMKEAADGRYGVMLHAEHVGTLIDATFYWMAEHCGRTYGPFRSRGEAMRTLVELNQAVVNPQTASRTWQAARRNHLLH